jgi:hypothetical protein
MPTTHQVIYIAATPEQAHLLKNALEERGIFSYLTNEQLQFALGDLPIGLPTAVRVVVQEHDAQEARRIALDFEEVMRHNLAGTEPDDSNQQDQVEHPAAPWPTCPDCRRPRHTSCPVCGTAGTKFKPGFSPPETDPADGTLAAGDLPRPLVLCPTCDEPFTPEFLARCEWCGHPFADGRPSQPPPTVSADSEFNARVGIVIAGLAAVLVAAVAYFLYIAS